MPQPAVTDLRAALQQAAEIEDQNELPAATRGDRRGGRPACDEDLFEGKRLYLALVGPFDDPGRFEALLAG